jgi:bifunctional UDP-N-acetylglucosamine pyrophosphorylase / glucosamine-1-phosphate N-acetyltransferase
MREKAAILLAAGKGTRMKSALPKVVHEVCGVPLICHVIRQLRALRIKKIVVVVGYGQKHVRAAVKNYGVDIVEQAEQLGTGHALLVSQTAFRSFAGDLLVLPGDVFIEDDTALKQFFTYHRKKKNALSILSAEIASPKGYGRIIRGADGRVCAIREEPDANTEEKKIREVNTGIYLFDGPRVFRSLQKIKKNSKKKEYYLTDIVDVYRLHDRPIGACCVDKDCAVLGVNDRSQLSEIQALLKKKIIRRLQMRGVTILEPQSTYIEADVAIGHDSVVYPYTYIENDVKIGKNCQIGPFCKIRSGSRINAGACIGSFVEVVRSSVGSKTNIKHLSYIGDAVIGDNVNIGAGTVTANYDGQHKHKTHIKNGAFIGSNSVLVAPVTIGKKAKTGAGSVVLKKRNVADGTVVCGSPARVITES